MIVILSKLCALLSSYQICYAETAIVKDFKTLGRSKHWPDLKSKDYRNWRRKAKKRTKAALGHLNDTVDMIVDVSNQEKQFPHHLQSHSFFTSEIHPFIYINIK